MTESQKATRATVRIGPIEVDGFMLPDGTYRMSQTQAAEAVGKPEINARRFLDSKAIKSLRGAGYTPDTIEIESIGQAKGQGRFNALPLDVVTAYWFNQATQNNPQALALVWAMLTETLERRFDLAFGVTRTEAARDEIATNRITQLSNALQVLGDAYATEDLIREEHQRFKKLLEQHGIDPYGLPE